MDPTPPVARSPASPLGHTSETQPLYEYPSPARSDSRSTGALLSYPCPMSNSGITNNNTAPNILSTEYDPFASFNPVVPSPYAQNLYTSQVTEPSVLPISPVLSATVSERSSLSYGGSVQSCTPRIKTEEQPEYTHDHDSMLINSSHLGQGILVTSEASYHSTAIASFYSDSAQSDWPKLEYENLQELPSISTLPFPHYDGRFEGQNNEPLVSARRPHISTARNRQPRKLTTKEDANFQCQVKGCGKLFGRSYNFKAHMETHDARREYPFPCPIQSCNKKFVRKTDLQRHHQSVHMKQRNHRCTFCSRYFARKDTLRRHMEDGCSKRFDIETMDLRPHTYGQHDRSTQEATAPLSIIQSRHTSDSMTQYSSNPGSVLGFLEQKIPSAESGASLDRPEFMTENMERVSPLWPH